MNRYPVGSLWRTGAGQRASVAPQWQGSYVDVPYGSLLLVVGVMGAEIDALVPDVWYSTLSGSEVLWVLDQWLSASTRVA